MIRIDHWPFVGIGIGNKFFMYAYSRFLAESLGYKLVSEPVQCCQNVGDKYYVKFDDIEGKDFSYFFSKKGPKNCQHG